MKFVKVAVRFSFVLGLCLTILAVGIARFARVKEAPPFQPLRKAHVQFHGLNDQAAIGREQGCRLFDPDTGRIVSMDLPENGMLLFGRSSPWEGPDGQVQVAGRWVSRNPDGPAGGVGEVGVARCTYPGGEVLDKVALDVVPLSAPCWFPGTAPRILFGGTDGHLYQFAFDDDPAAGANAGESARHPEPIEWACAKPGLGDVRISDPSWPADARLGGRVLVSLTYIDHVGDQKAFVPAQIWWLELSRDGRAIRAAGRLTAERHHASRPSEEQRLPNLAATPEGGLVLAYIARPAGQVGWDLKLAPVVIDTESGLAHARSRTSVLLARGVAVAPPTFSTDGRWVHGLLSSSGRDVHAEKFSVAAALSARTERLLAWRTDPNRVASRRAQFLEPLRLNRSQRVGGKS